MELSICKQSSWITIILRERGRSASYMSIGASATSNMLFEEEYDPVTITNSIQNAVTWAEARYIQLRDSYNKMYPWRSKSES